MAALTMLDNGLETSYKVLVMSGIRLKRKT